MCVVEGGMWKPTPSKIYQKHSFLRYPGIWVSVFTNYSTTGTCVLVLVPPFPFPVNDWVVHTCSVCVCVCAHLPVHLYDVTTIRGEFRVYCNCSL